MATEAEITVPQFSLAEIVRLIEKGEPAGMEALYVAVHRNLRRYFTCHHDGSSAEDMTHDVLLGAVTFVRRGKLREPKALISLVWTIARRRLVTVIRERNDERTAAEGRVYMPVHSDAFDHVHRLEQAEIARQVLREMPSLSRQILIRFYIHEQTPEQICADLRITQRQFRLIKWRAKARFAELGKKSLAATPLAPPDGPTQVPSEALPGRDARVPGLAPPRRLSRRQSAGTSAYTAS
jgi:RNA polymerase sigma factor (sigma-70 family)